MYQSLPDGQKKRISLVKRNVDSTDAITAIKKKKGAGTDCGVQAH